GVLSFAIIGVALTSMFRPTLVPKLEGWVRDLAFFGVGLWLGFLQVGVGFLLLACLVGGLRMDLVKANAAKVLIVLIVTVPILVIFQLAGQVFWREGLLVAAGTMAGAWIAARLAIEKGAAWIRWVVVAAAAAAVVKLLVFPSGAR
ncbi:MAG: sulfite exporter TauE/SafE family protein, partial [Planctomycetota bacterium]|nr:sulfite exporter TauE/SafE family protein [Planctomycetota bacterium]